MTDQPAPTARDTCLLWWAHHQGHTAAQVARHFNGPGREQLPADTQPIKSATLRQWKARHGLPPTAPEHLEAAPTEAPLELRKAAQASAPSADPAQAESLLQPAAVWVELSTVVPWVDNPRENDDAAQRVARSIARFGYGRAFVGWRPEDQRMLVVGHTARKATLLLLQRRPVYDFQADTRVDGRPRACLECGQPVDGRHADGCKVAIPPEVPREGWIPMRWRGDWSEEEARGYAVADNQLGTLAGWVPTMLAQQLRDLEQHDMDHGLLGWDADTSLDDLLAELMGPGEGDGPGEGAGDKGDGGASLADRFGVPPFSLLDARQGYWKDRKRQWLALGIQSELGRAGLGDTICMTKHSYMADRVQTGDAGSIFDPVLMELAVRWFAPEHGDVLDPFAGGSVRGVVAAALGHPYTGVDLRGEQVVANRVQYDRIASEVGASAAPTGTTGPLPTTVAELMVGFKPVTTDCASTWAPYLAGFAMTRRWPRYYSAPLWLASEGKKFLHGLVGGCLVVVKRSTIFKNRVLYLIVPPMHPDGDIAAERAVVQAFAAAGVSTKLSSEDLDALGYEDHQVEADKGNAEFLYRVGDYADLAGGDWRDWRRNRAALAALQTRTWTDKPAPPAALDQAELVAQDWAKGRDKVSPKHVAKVLRMAGADTGTACPARMALLCTPEGTPLLAAASQQLTDTWAVLLSRVRHPDAVLPSANVAGHLVDVEHYQHLGPDGLVNAGAAGQRGAGLLEAKRHLRPVHELQLHDLVLASKFTEADWQAVHPDKLGASSPVSGLAARELPTPTWIQGDSRHLDQLLPEGQLYDLVATCPPYGDLEVYSDDPADISAMDWAGFVEAYREILAGAVARLRPDRFVVVVVGDVRDKRGSYRGLVRVTEQALEDAGAAIYNHAIYVTPAGTIPIRAGPHFMAGRKLAKTHQNVIVGYTGDPRKIREALGDPPQWAAPDATHGED